MLPTMPTPMTTTSTSLSRCATLLPLSNRCGNFGVNVHVTLPVLADAHRLSLELHSMSVDRFVVISVGSGKADHPPRNHVAVAAVNRIAEEALDRHLQQHVEEDC